jgi:hypothetical protein
MKIRCQDNGGFEQYLTVGKLYDVKNFYTDENGTTLFGIIHDKGTQAHYKAVRFIHTTFE